MVDEDLEATGSRERVEFGAVNGIFFQGPEMGIFQDGNVEPFFVPEMVIYRGKIGVGPAADFPDSGVSEAPVGKDLAGGVQEALAGFGGW
jgi:hypothetical protein